MDDKDLTIQRLRQETGRWKNRTLEAASECCDRCRMIFNHSQDEQPPCDGCRIKRIMEEAEK